LSELPAPIRITAFELSLAGGHFQDLAISQPVIITVNDQEQNALMATDVFMRYMDPDRRKVVVNTGNAGLPPEKLRDKYIYRNALYPRRRS
jgi:hypothetical protein